MKKYLYCSLATNEKYLKGITFLYNSYLKTKSDIPFLALITDNLSNNDLYILQKNNVPYKIVPYLSFIHIKDNENIFRDTLNKFYIFTLKEYEKVFFLDADIFLFKNIDFLFDLSEANKIVTIQHQLNENDIQGGSFIINPSDFNFSEIIKNYQKNYHNDEQVLNNLYNKDNVILKQIDDSIFYHDGGPNIKYWETLNINLNYFFDLKTETQKSFFLNYWVNLKNKYLKNNYLYVTLATNSKYLKGAIYLYYSYKNTKSKYPFLILVTDNLKKEDYEELEKNKISYKIIPYKSFSNEDSPYKDTINKFEIFNLKEYEKILFIDADSFFIQNIDFFFDIPMKNNILAYERKENNNTLLGGNLFIVKPQDIEINDYLQQHLNSWADEPLLTELFYKNHDIIDKNLIQNNYIYHDGCKNKYWEVLQGIDFYKFFQLDKKDLEYFSLFYNKYKLS